MEGGLGLEPVQHYVVGNLPPKQYEPDRSNSKKRLSQKSNQDGLIKLFFNKVAALLDYAPEA